jgi:hypothetical protein
MKYYNESKLLIRLNENYNILIDYIIDINSVDYSNN